MTIPHHGRQRGRALAGLLLAGLLLAALAGQDANAQDRNSPRNLDFVSSIDSLAQLLNDALERGDSNKEIRQLDQALKHLILALESQQKGNHQHHKKGKGGSFQKGMTQFASGGWEDQSHSYTQSINQGGKGSSGKGHSGVGGGAASKGGSGGGAGQVHAGSGNGSKSGGKCGVSNGINQVTTTINNTFNGPAKVNINNGQQQITLAGNLRQVGGCGQNTDHRQPRS